VKKKDGYLLVAAAIALYIAAAAKKAAALPLPLGDFSDPTD
jgi:hypothetical protein